MESPDHPDFWNQRYTASRTPWDFGGVPAALTQFLDQRPAHGKHVLIPGCGSGYEIEAFAQAGYRVTAIDFSGPAATRAQAGYGHLGQAILQADFFTHPFPAGSFDLIYERTFLCALPPERWPTLSARMAELIRPGGLLAGLFFFGPKEDGPPFGLNASEPHELFGRWFTLIEDQPTTDSLPLFAGRERWQLRERIRPV